MALITTKWSDIVKKNEIIEENKIVSIKMRIVGNSSKKSTFIMDHSKNNIFRTSNGMVHLFNVEKESRCLYQLNIVNIKEKFVNGFIEEWCKYFSESYSLYISVY